MPSEIHIPKDYNIKANIEAGKNYPLKHTNYAGGYEFNLDARDVQLYQMIQSKLSKQSKNRQCTYKCFRTSSCSYYHRDDSSLIMFTD